MLMRTNESQKIIASSKAILRPGVFSNYSLVSKVGDGSFLNNSFQQSKTNTTQDTTKNALIQSVDVNLQAYQLLQQHLLLPQKQKTPNKPPQGQKYQSDDNIRRSSSIQNQQKVTQQPNEFLQALLEQNINNNKTKRSLKSGSEMRNILIPNLYSILNEKQDNKVSSPPKEQKRKSSSQRRQKCPSQHINSQHISKPRNDSLDKSGKVQKHLSVDPLPQKSSKNLDKQQTPKNILQHQQQTVKSGKKLNFNLLSTPQEQDNVYLDKSNQMANMIIENILNKEDYYERLKKENQDLKEIQFTLQKQNQDLRKSYQNSEIFLQEVKQTLDAERSKYHKELVRFQDKLSIVKSLQTQLQNEKIQGDTMQIKLQENSSTITQFKDILSSIALSSIDFVGNLQQQSKTLEITQEYDDIMPSILLLLQNALHLVFEIIQNTQQIKLPALKDCHIPENFDFRSFFDFVETLHQKNKNKFSNLPDESYQESQEISFRQKHPSINQIQISLPISQVQNKQSMVPSRNFSIQDQFNTFLELQDEVEELPLQFQIGSPYFNHTQPLFVGQKETAKDMPLQMNVTKAQFQNQNFQFQQRQNHFKTDSIDESQGQSQQQPLLRNFSAQNRNIKHLSEVLHRDENEQDTYDSLFQEFNKNEPKQKKNSVHSMNYLDEQANRITEQDKKKQYKIPQSFQVRGTSSDKENQQSNDLISDIKNQYCGPSAHCIDTWGIAKSSYNAIKENDLTFSKGDKIQILKKTQNGKWIGLFEKQIGYFPHNMVVIQGKKDPLDKIPDHQNYDIDLLEDLDQNQLPKQEKFEIKYKGNHQ